jgi:hypothetical protein
MAISYPRSLLTHTGFESIELRAMNAVAISQSPFTFSTQVHAYQGQMWQADVKLPPMPREDAEKWVAWLVSLRGQFGTFLLGDPLGASPRGTATAATVTGASGDNTVSATVDSGDTLLAGDYIQLGSAADATLHKVLVDYTGTGTAADLEIWPALRTTRSAVSATLTNPQGVFRLASNEQAWSINNTSFYGVTFGAVEAI